MPAMMGNQPMKDDYVSGLEKRVARKVGDVAAAGRKLSGAAVRIGKSTITDRGYTKEIEQQGRRLSDPARKMMKKMIGR
jgi:hypothetical protein